MAKRVIQQTIDDIDGSPADESLSFGLDGTHYTIDLTSTNAGHLRDALAPYITAARRVPRTALPGERGRSAGQAAAVPARADRDRNQAIREWAQRHGIEVSDRGRLARDVIERYEAAGGR